MILFVLIKTKNSYLFATLMNSSGKASQEDSDECQYAYEHLKPLGMCFSNVPLLRSALHRTQVDRIPVGK